MAAQHGGTRATQAARAQQAGKQDCNSCQPKQPLGGPPGGSTHVAAAGACCSTGSPASQQAICCSLLTCAADGAEAAAMGQHLADAGAAVVVPAGGDGAGRQVVQAAASSVAGNGRQWQAMTAGCWRVADRQRPPPAACKCTTSPEHTGPSHQMGQLLRSSCCTPPAACAGAAPPSPPAPAAAALPLSAASSEASLLIMCCRWCQVSLHSFSAGQKGCLWTQRWVCKRFQPGAESSTGSYVRTCSGDGCPGALVRVTLGHRLAVRPQHQLGIQQLLLSLCGRAGKETDRVSQWQGKPKPCT